MEARFIFAGTEFNSRDKHIPAPLFRKEFACTDITGTHKLVIGATGFYRIFLNGEELTKGPLAPYISNPDHTVYYDEYDLSGKLLADNVLCVLLGNGFGNALDCNIWEYESAPYRSAPKMFLCIYGKDGTALCSDDSFDVFDSPITFDDLRFGEFFDARLVRPELFERGSVSGGRKAAVAPPPKGELKKCTAQPLRRFEEVAAKTVTKSDGGFIFDFGQNNTGIFRLHITGRSGQKVKLTFGEILRDGKLFTDNIRFAERRIGYDVQYDEYICTDGEQTYEPSFTYHGYRYAFVEGIEEAQAKPELLTMIVMHSDITPVGHFACSDEVINKIEECTCRSDVSNFLYFPTDCPHREKNGWTGDIVCSAEQLLYHYDCVLSLREWLGVLRKTQKENGRLPGIAPTSTWGYDWGSGPAWDSALVEVPYQIYRFTKDTGIIFENADAIEKYFAYADTKLNSDGLLAYGLGDWREAGSVMDITTPLEVTDTLVMTDTAKKASELLAVIGHTEQSEKIGKWGKKLERQFWKKYAKNGEITCKTQTAQAKAIACGIFGKDELTKAYDVLKKMLADNNGRFKVGVIGAKVLFDVLVRAGAGDEALEAIIGPQFPSYGFWLSKGATTLWESFMDGDDIWRDSRNHHFWGSVSAWFFKTLAGLDIVSRGKAEICPHTLSRLSWAEASHSYKDLSLFVRWERKDGGIEFCIRNKGYTGNISVPGYETDGKKTVPLEDGERIYSFLPQK